MECPPHSAREGVNRALGRLCKKQPIREKLRRAANQGQAHIRRAATQSRVSYSLEPKKGGLGAFRWREASTMTEQCWA